MTKKRFLLALALMLTAVGGAWAQGSVTATQLNIPDEWAGYTNRLTASDLQGFVPVTAEQAQAWNNIPSGDIFLIYGFNNNGEALYALFQNGSIYTQNPLVSAPLYLNDVWMMSQNVQYYYVSGVTAAAPLLNWDAATRTGSLTVPAGNVTLTVDYYGQYTLDSVPTAEGWQVKVNGSLATVTPYSPGSALGHVDNINETDSVELIPPAELRETIKAVRLTEVVPAPEPITVTINQSDWGGYDTPFTKDGVTVTAGGINPNQGNLTNGGSFSTTLGNFTSIVVTTFSCEASGTGWSSCSWSGTPASSVSFSGSFMGMGLVQTTIVCTIQPNN